MAQPQLAVPGQVLGSSSKFTPGHGTHIAGDQLVSSLLGQPTTSTTKRSGSSNQTLAVQRPTHPSSRPAPVLPTVGAVVYCRISRIAQSTAQSAILVIDDVVAPAGYRGILRSVDVRATEKDKVRLSECFRVGDVVRAAVVSLGDQGGYFLSTAGNEFGVVMAWSDAGNGCAPVSWNEVRDEVTGAKELRKVAKPF